MTKQQWNFNLDEAPKSVLKDTTKDIDGTEVVIQVLDPEMVWATNGITILRTYWLPDKEEWIMFDKDNPPLAWQPYYIPELPTIEHEELKGNEQVSK